MPYEPIPYIFYTCCYSQFPTPWHHSSLLYGPLQENQVGLKLNGTRQLQVYADVVSLLGDNTDDIKKNTET
jgi:hypothetical protein